MSKKDPTSIVKVENDTPSSPPTKPVGSLKKPSAEWLKQQGVDPHTVKEALPGPPAHFDIFKDKANNIFAKRKGAPDFTAEWLGHLDDFADVV